MISEDQLKIWAQAPSATKYITTRGRIETALVNKFGDKIDVYLQGSYKNSTNTRSESDVDIIVEYLPAYYPGFFHVSEEEQALYHQLTNNHDYTFSQFKSDVHDVLLDEFSVDEVKRRPKCIKVLKNENRVNADVIACFTHQRYINAREFDAVGIHFFTDSGEEIVNFPRQHHENGEKKNGSYRTNGKFKEAVRIYKNIMYKLVDSGELEEDEIPSHFIECIVWNTPDPHFTGTYTEIIKSVTKKVWNDMKSENDPHSKYSHIHDLEWLFVGAGKKTPEDATKFMEKVWTFVGF